MNFTTPRTRTAVPYFLLAALCTLPVAAQTRPVPNPQLASKELNQRVDALLKKMTLDEKIGQLAQFSAGFATGPGAAGKNQASTTWSPRARSAPSSTSSARKPPTTTSTSPWRSPASISPSSSGWTSSTATAPRSPSRSPSPPPWTRRG